MLRFHSASVVSSIGADEAMPALETRMSRPPILDRRVGEGARRPRPRRSRPCVTPRDVVLAVAPGERGLGVASSAGSSMSASTTQAPSREKPRGGRAADAAGAAGDERDAAGEALRLRHALELGLLEQPVLDVEGFLLGQADDRSTTVEAPRMTLMALT